MPVRHGEAALAGLPRLVRVADEARWRGQTLAGTAVCVVLFWTAVWLLGQPVRPVDTGLALGAILIPTTTVALITSGRRVREALERSRPAPRASVHETHAAARERRTKAAAMVLTGVVALLVLDRLTNGGGVMAALVAGLFAVLGAVDLREARAWEAAEARRETRLHVLLDPQALVPRYGRVEVYETPRPGAGRRDLEPSPFDLGI